MTSSSSSVDGRSRTNTATSPPLSSLPCPSGYLAKDLDDVLPRLAVGTERRPALS